MKRTMEVLVVAEYDDEDIVIEGDTAYLTKATVNGYGTPLQDEIVEIINEDAMCGNQLYWSRQEYDREREIDVADYRYHRYCDDLCDAKWGAA